MALLHHADISPTKLELLAAWLPGRTWFSGDASAVERVAACRFDDPAGEVGIEIMMVRAGDGPVLHVPMTYRGAPLAGGDAFLIGTTEHSVLGKRWVYDACGDPVYVAALADAVLTGGTQAEEYFEVDGQKQVREAVMTVEGSGSHAQVPALGEVRHVTDGALTFVKAEGVELSVVRVAGVHAPSGDDTLVGSWPGLSTPVVLATARLI